MKDLGLSPTILTLRSMILASLKLEEKHAEAIDGLIEAVFFDGRAQGIQDARKILGDAVERTRMKRS